MGRGIKYDVENVPVSKETRKGMTLNIDDITWLERRFSLQEQTFADEMEDLFNGFALKLCESFQQHNKLVFTAIDKLTVSVDNLGKEIHNLNMRIDDIDARVQKLEKIIFSDKS